MKKYIIFFLLFIIVCLSALLVFKKPKPEYRTVVKEVIINYSKDDNEYKRHGTYKEIFRYYDYEYKDSTYHLLDIKEKNRAGGVCINEFGDTIHVIYTDTSNFPHR